MFQSDLHTVYLGLPTRGSRLAWLAGSLRLDCWAAGNLLQNFNMYAERRDHEINILHGGYPVSRGSSTTDEFYPISCLWCKRTSSILSRVICRHIHFMSSPINAAVRYFIMNHQQHYCRPGGATTRRLKGSSYPTWQTQLDFFCNYRYYRVDYPFARNLHEPLP